jgi:hypothetical protein
MPVIGRPRDYHGDRPATSAERQARWRQAQLSPAHLQQRLAALAPDARCRTFGACTLFCCDWKDVAALFPMHIKLRL